MGTAGQSRPTRRYSDKQRAEALAILVSNGGNLHATSRETTIPISTLKGWRDESLPDVRALALEKQASLAELWESVTRDSLHLIARAAAALAAGDDAALLDYLSDLNRIAGTGTDKSLALRGEPTEFHRHEVVLDLGAAEL